MVALHDGHYVICSVLERPASRRLGMDAVNQAIIHACKPAAWFSYDRTLQVAKDMATLVKEGINSFKFFMAYKGALQVSDTELIKAMQHCKTLGALPMVQSAPSQGPLLINAHTF